MSEHRRRERKQLSDAEVSFVLLLALSTASACAPAKTSGPPPASPAPVAPAKPEVASQVDTTGLPDWLAREIAELELVSADHARDLTEGAHVVIGKTRVVVDGDEVARVAEIAPGGKLRRVDALFETLKRKRERFKSEHPGEPFPGRVTYWVDARVSAAVLKSVFQTCAFAGYPYGQFAVRRREDPRRFGQLGANARVPGPPSQDGGETGTFVRGRLPPEVIQRIVRQNYEIFRRCYAKALEKEPELRGRVVVRFVIGLDGKVSQPTENGSTLPNRDVVECVRTGFGKLEFPAPEGGIVTVVYPIEFSPD